MLEIKLNNSFFIVMALSTFLLSILLVWLFRRFALQRGLLDIPNARSAHQESVVRGGGIVFVLLWVLEMGLACQFYPSAAKTLWVFFPMAILMALLGLWDDCRGLSSKRRLVIQILIACSTVFLLGGASSLHWSSTTLISLGWLGSALAVLALVWSTNLFNFMDGLDGLAATEALFVFCIGGILFWLTGALEMAYSAWILVASLAGFLVWNWPKARIFMGDAGSYFLGFLITLFALIGDRKYQLPITIWIILFGTFWFDATMTVIRRWYYKENVAIAHREHAYQRLHRAGFSPRQILGGVIVLNGILATISLGVYFEPALSGWALGLTLVILSGVYGAIEKVKPMVSTI